MYHYSLFFIVADILIKGFWDDLKQVAFIAAAGKNKYSLLRNAIVIWKLDRRGSPVFNPPQRALAELYTVNADFENLDIPFSHFSRIRLKPRLGSTFFSGSISWNIR